MLVKMLARLIKANEFWYCLDVGQALGRVVVNVGTPVFSATCFHRCQAQAEFSNGVCACLRTF